MLLLLALLVVAQLCATLGAPPADLQHMRVRELRAYLKAENVECKACIERDDFLDAARRHVERADYVPADSPKPAQKPTRKRRKKDPRWQQYDALKSLVADLEDEKISEGDVLGELADRLKMADGAGRKTSGGSDGAQDTTPLGTVKRFQEVTDKLDGLSRGQGLARLGRPLGLKKGMNDAQLETWLEKNCGKTVEDQEASSALKEVKQMIPTMTGLLDQMGFAFEQKAEQQKKQQKKGGRSARSKQQKKGGQKKGGQKKGGRSARSKKHTVELSESQLAEMQQKADDTKEELRQAKERLAAMKAAAQENSEL